MAPCEDCNNNLVVLFVKWLPGLLTISIMWMAWLSLASISTAKTVGINESRLAAEERNTLMIVDALKSQGEAFEEMSKQFAVHDAIQKEVAKKNGISLN